MYLSIYQLMGIKAVSTFFFFFLRKCSREHLGANFCVSYIHLKSSGCVPRSVIADLVGNSNCNLLKNARTVFVCNSIFCVGEIHSWTLDTLNFCNLEF